MTNFKELVSLIHSIDDEELLEDFMIGLTTPRERHELMQRVEIIKRLLAHETQKGIAKELGVGVATVTRGSKELARDRFKVLKKDCESVGDRK